MGPTAHLIEEFCQARSKVKMSRFILSACCLMVALSAMDLQAGAADTALSENPVFQKSCAKCHGKTAEGRHFGGPSLASEKAQAASEEELISIITNGKGHMPKYGGKLSEADIRTLVEQIRGLSKK